MIKIAIYAELTRTPRLHTYVASMRDRADAHARTTAVTVHLSTYRGVWIAHSHTLIHSLVRWRSLATPVLSDPPPSGPTDRLINEPDDDDGVLMLRSDSQHLFASVSVDAADAAA